MEIQLRKTQKLGVRWLKETTLLLATWAARERPDGHGWAMKENPAANEGTEGIQKRHREAMKTLTQRLERLEHSRGPQRVELTIRWRDVDCTVFRENLVETFWTSPSYPLKLTLQWMDFEAT